MSNEKWDGGGASIIGDVSISIIPRSECRYRKPKNGKKKHRYETHSYTDITKDGDIVHVSRVFDRENDRYKEVVSKEDNGEIIHQKDESLSQHIGHGSDKYKSNDGC